jgi:PAS domain S-box-containing protein
MQKSKEDYISSENVLILAPTGKDGELTARFLSDAGFAAEVCSSVVDLCRKISKNAGIALLAGEALEQKSVSILKNELRRQPPWSDIPLIVLTSGGGANPTNAATLEALAEIGNVTLIERPIRLMTLVSAVKSALRARRKQFEARDFLSAEIKAKEKLQISEERFRALQQATPDGFMIFESERDQTGKIADFRWVYANPAVERIIGRSEKDLLGKRLLEELPGNVNELFNEYVKVVEGGEVFQSELEYLYDELNHYFRITAVKVGDGFAVGFSDVTKQRQSEIELRSARLRLESTLAAAEVGTWTWDCVNNVVVADKNLAQMFSVAADEAKGARIESYLRSIHPDDRTRAIAVIQQAIRNADEYEAEYRLVAPNGKIRWVIARGIIERDELGNAVSLPGVVVDITERKQTEAALRESEGRFRQIANSMPQIVWSTTPEGYHDYFNERWYEYTGMPSDGNQGWNWKDYLHSEDYDRSLAVWQNSLQSGKPYNVEYRLKNAEDDSYRWFVARALPVKNDAGEIVRWFGTCTDIEAQKQAAKEMEAARLQAENANRLKDEFLATVSHELRTPLNSILGWAQMFRRGQLGSEITLQRAFETIERNARAQNQLIEDLLDVSRIISGKVRLDIQPVNLASIIEAALDAVRPAAEARGVSLLKKLDSETGLISGDPDRLQQIVWNLLSNAIKFTERDGKVEVRLEQVNSQVEIVVADDGKGIEPEFLPYVFDRFRQADSSSKRQYGGLGLGLSIVRHLTELHGGSAEVMSEGEGKGATFIIKLPRIGIVAEPDGKTHSSERKNRHYGEIPNLSGVKVLVVDDDEDTRVLLSAVLSQTAAQVKTAASVPQALKLLEAELFALLISDIEMPQTDGYDLIRSVRRMSQLERIPAIAVTAYARAEDRARAISAGYDMHISKPVESQELLTVAASLVKRNN